MRQIVYVRDVMSSNPVCVDEQEHLSDAYEVMENRHIMHFPVMRDGRLVGMLSERHLRDAMPSVLTIKDPAARQKSLALTRVGQVYQALEDSVQPTTRVAEVIFKMRNLRIGALPVVDGGKVVGIVTSGDLISLLEKMLDGKV